MKISEFQSLVKDPQYNLSHPLGSVTTVQHLISLHKRNPNVFAEWFTDGSVLQPTQDLISTALAFLAPKFVASSDGRANRRQQVKILEGQKTWPDLASIHNAASLFCSDTNSIVGLPRQLYPDSINLIDWNGFSYLLTQLIGVTGIGKIPAFGGMNEVTHAALAKPNW